MNGKVKKASHTIKQAKENHVILKGSVNLDEKIKKFMKYLKVNLYIKHCYDDTEHGYNRQIKLDKWDTGNIMNWLSS